jgi:hypothetical protein
MHRAYVEEVLLRTYKIRSGAVIKPCRHALKCTSSSSCGHDTQVAPRLLDCAGSSMDHMYRSEFMMLVYIYSHGPAVRRDPRDWERGRECIGIYLRRENNSGEERFQWSCGHLLLSRPEPYIYIYGYIYGLTDRKNFADMVFNLVNYQGK